MLVFKRFFAKIFAFFVVNKIKRSYRKGPEIQKKVLKELIENGKKTIFGTEHNFDEIINKCEDVEIKKILKKSLENKIIELFPFASDKYDSKKAIEDIRYHFRRGKKKVLLVAPTGSGKTIIACSMIEGAKKNYNLMGHTSIWMFPIYAFGYLWV